MKKLSTLKIEELKRLLRERELPTSGTKAELIERLSRFIGTDEIGDNGEDSDIFEESSATITSQSIQFPNVNVIPQNIENMNLQRQIDDLKKTLEMALSAFQNVAQQNVAQTSTLNVQPAYNVQQPTSTNSQNNLRANNQCSVREIAETIPEFDPTNDSSLSVELFVERVESAIEAYQWEEKCLLLAVYSRMKGVARLWLDSVQMLHSNWKDFAKDLVSEFKTTYDESEVHFKMINAVRKNDEKITDYCFRMSALGKRYKLSERAIVKYTREGLQNRDIQFAIASQKIDSIKQLREVLIEYERNVPERRGFKSIDTKCKSNVDKTANNGRDNICFSKFKSEREIKCFNCNENGHISSSCPKPQKRPRCAKCKKVHPKNETECRDSATVRNMFCNHDDFFKIKVILDNTELSAFVDTGSQCSLIKKSICIQMNFDVVKCSMKISGICGGMCFAKEKIVKNLVINDIEMFVTLYIVDDELLLTDILLGQDIFSNNVIMQYQDGKIKFGSKTDGELNSIDDDSDNYNNYTCDNKLNRIKINEQDIICELNDEIIKTDLMKLIKENESIFSCNLQNLGKTDLVQMKIKLEDNKVVSQRPYRVPESKKAKISEIVRELLNNDVVSVSESEYASPVVLQKKKNGSERLCIDYRQLNQYIVKENFPSPNIEECLQEAKKYKYFTILDLNSGYYQIPIEPESRKYTAFITTDGLYEFKRMPFGLKNAPMVFQRLMAKIQERVGKENMMHYMDDILIGSEDINNMFRKLKIVFKVIKSANLTINLKKCEFFKTTVEYLGHQLTPDGISPGKIKSEAIQNFQRPTNIKEIRRFLGLSGYFRKFIPKFAIISEPLRKLLRKDQEFIWTSEQETAFCELKTKLSTQPVMTNFRLEAEHEIHTDASSVGLAGVLLQKEEGKLKPVAYYSRSTSTIEKNFHSYELETLAVVETLERFRYYIYGKQIKIVTDCSAVKATMAKRELIPRIARWWLKIQDFSIKIEHRKGQNMEHVDALSRMPNELPSDIDVATLRVDKIELHNDDWLYSMQIQDDAVKDIIAKFQDCDKITLKEYCMENGRLFRKHKKKNLMVVPKSLRWRVVEDCHDKNGHLSVEKTIDKLLDYVWFPRMRNFVKSYINSCIECAYNKNKGGRSEGEYHFSKVEPIPFYTIHMDHLGPFPKSSKRNEYILLIVDSFTKYTYLKAVKSTASKHVLNALKEFSSYFGVPTRIITDRGTSFTSKEFKRYCHDNDIKHILNAVRTPRANGHAERANRTLLSMLLPTVKKDKQWDEHLTKMQWCLNTMVNKTSGKSPHELLFCFSPRDILQNKILLSVHKNYHRDEDEMKNLRQEVSERINMKRAKAKARFDENHSSPHKYKINDLVLVENEPLSTGTSRKLEPHYKGPFIIKKVLDNDRYVIEDLPGSKRKTRHYSSVYASDKMKPCWKLPSLLNEEDEAYSLYDSEDA